MAEVTARAPVLGWDRNPQKARLARFGPEAAVDHSGVSPTLLSFLRRALVEELQRALAEEAQLLFLKDWWIGDIQDGHHEAPNLSPD